MWLAGLAHGVTAIVAREDEHIEEDMEKRTRSPGGVAIFQFSGETK